MCALSRSGGVRYNQVVLRVSILGLCAIGLSGCVDERSLPPPAQMCRDLVEVCGDRILWEYSDAAKACYDVGRAGVRDSRNEDRCFANYEECASDCDYLAYWLSYYDAGLDSGERSNSDAPASDATSSSGASFDSAPLEAGVSHRDAGDASDE